MSNALQDFLVSLFQLLLERYVENVFINRAKGGENLNSDQESAQQSICLQFSCKPGQNHNGVFVYCIINIGACFGNACTIAERSHNLFACPSVFLYLRMRGIFSKWLIVYCLK